MGTNPMEYIWPGIIVAQAISAAARLGIPDRLASGAKTVAELAAHSGTHARALERLLRALSSLEMFALNADGGFQNTPLSEVLRTDHPQSQRDVALFLPAAFLWRPLGELHESVRTGEPAFQRVFGQRFFEYLAEHPSDAAIFNTVMTQGIAWATPPLLAAYDFSHFQLLVDVGGGCAIYSRPRRACVASCSIYLKRSPALQKSWEAISAGAVKSSVATSSTLCQKALTPIC